MTDSVDLKNIQSKVATGADTIDPRLLVNSPYQPRTFFSQQETEELKASIFEAEAVLVPVIARPGSNELIAGQRRTSIAIELNYSSIPVYWHDCTDREAEEFAALENTKRADLNPIDETNMVVNMVRLRLNLTDRDAAIDLITKASTQSRSKKVISGNNVIPSDMISQLEEVIQLFTKGGLTLNSFYANKLKLLKIPADIQKAIQAGELEYSKGAEIAKVKNPDFRKDLLDVAMVDDMSLSQIKDEILKSDPVKKDKKEKKETAKKTAKPKADEEGNGGLDHDLFDVNESQGITEVPVKKVLPNVKVADADVDGEINVDRAIERKPSPVRPVPTRNEDDDPLDIKIEETLEKVRSRLESEAFNFDTKQKIDRLLSQIVALMD